MRSTNEFQIKTFSEISIILTVTVKMMATSLFLVPCWRSFTTDVEVEDIVEAE